MVHQHGYAIVDKTSFVEAIDLLEILVKMPKMEAIALEKQDKLSPEKSFLKVNPKQEEEQKNTSTPTTNQSQQSSKVSQQSIFL